VKEEKTSQFHPRLVYVDSKNYITFTKGVAETP
jgi:aspartate 1-decarboxylase